MTLFASTIICFRISANTSLSSGASYSTGAGVNNASAWIPSSHILCLAFPSVRPARGLGLLITEHLVIWRRARSFRVYRFTKRRSFSKRLRRVCSPKDSTKCLTAVLQQHLGHGNRRKGIYNFFYFRKDQGPAYILIEAFSFLNTFSVFLLSLSLTADT